MDKKLILHIPHSSIVIPDYDGYILNHTEVENEIEKLTDWYTDDLFSGSEDIKVIAEFSRVFCDVERFSDDKQEVMAQYGMGVLYEKSDSGEDMRLVSNALRDEILSKYYHPHHQRLSCAVNNELKAHGQALIIDCHSYSDTPFLRDLNQDSNRPDFCIGTDNFHTPDWLIDFSVDYFKTRGYSLGINEPYSGAIVPMEFYQKNSKVHSIMLEINRKLYLKNGTSDKSDNYSNVKRLVTEFIQMIKNESAYKSFKMSSNPTSNPSAISHK